MKDLVGRTRRLFEIAEGFPEPTYNAQGVITNWPRLFLTEFDQVIRAISETANTEELNGLAVWYESFQNPQVPDALFHIVSRCLYDNPNWEIPSS